MAYKKKYTIPDMEPVAWKRPGLNGTTFYDSQKHSKLAVGLHVAKCHGNSRTFQGPLFFEMVFFGPIPKSSKIRLPGQFISTTPDASNLQKFIEDVMTDCHIYEDDKQIAGWIGVHIYSTKPRTIIRVSEIGDEHITWLADYLKDLDEKP